MRLRVLPIRCTLSLAVAADRARQLPGTEPLTPPADPAAEVVAGLDREAVVSVPYYLHLICIRPTNSSSSVRSPATSTNPHPRCRVATATTTRRAFSGFFAAFRISASASTTSPNTTRTGFR